MVLALYLFVAARTFYQDKVIAAAVKAVILTASLSYITALYRFILFLTSLYSA